MFGSPSMWHVMVTQFIAEYLFGSKCHLHNSVRHNWNFAVDLNRCRTSLPSRTHDILAVAGMTLSAIRW